MILRNRLLFSAGDFTLMSKKHVKCEAIGEKVIWITRASRGIVSFEVRSKALREATSTIKTKCEEKICNFVEIVEFQIDIKNYDPQKDKRFSTVSVKLLHIPRREMKICMFGDAEHVEESSQHNTCEPPGILRS